MKSFLVIGLFTMVFLVASFGIHEYYDTHKHSQQRDNLYIQSLKEYEPNRSFDRDEYIQLAQTSCTLLQAGKSSIYIFSSAPDDFSAYAIYTGVSIYCPAYLEIITDTN